MRWMKACLLCDGTPPTVRLQPRLHMHWWTSEWSVTILTVTCTSVFESVFLATVRSISYSRRDRICLRGTRRRRVCQRVSLVGAAGQALEKLAARRRVGGHELLRRLVVHDNAAVVRRLVSVLGAQARRRP